MNSLIFLRDLRLNNFIFHLSSSDRMTKTMYTAKSKYSYMIEKAILNSYKSQIFQTNQSISLCKLLKWAHKSLGLPALNLLLLCLHWHFFS